MLTASCLDVFLQEEKKMNVTSTIIKYLFVFIIQLIFVLGHSLNIENIVWVSTHIVKLLFRDEIFSVHYFIFKLF